MYYQFKVYDEDGDEVQVLEIDYVDSGEEGVLLAHVYLSARDNLDLD